MTTAPKVGQRVYWNPPDGRHLMGKVKSVHPEVKRAMVLIYHGAAVWPPFAELKPADSVIHIK